MSYSPMTANTTMNSEVLLCCLQHCNTGAFEVDYYHGQDGTTAQ